MAKNGSVDRRDFLKSAAVTGAALVGGAAGAEAQTAPPAPAAAAPASAPVAPRETDPVARSRHRHDRSPGRRLHGRRAQVARLRVRRRQSGLELPRHPRIDHQLRRQHGAGVHHLLPRRIVGRDGARLLQGRRQADGGARATARSACSTRRWRSTTPTATACRSYILAGNTLDATMRRPGVEWDAQRAGRGGDGARLHQVGRPADLAAALRRVGGARLQDRDDAADDAGAARRSTAACRKIRSRPRCSRGCASRS